MAPLQLFIFLRPCVCSCCRRQGPVPKQLQLNLERACANDEWLASARQLQERDTTIVELRAQVKELVLRVSRRARH